MFLIYLYTEGFNRCECTFDSAVTSENGGDYTIKQSSRFRCGRRSHKYAVSYAVRSGCGLNKSARFFSHVGMFLQSSG